MSSGHCLEEDCEYNLQGMCLSDKFCCNKPISTPIHCDRCERIFNDSDLRLYSLHGYIIAKSGLHRNIQLCKDCWEKFDKFIGGE